MRYRRGGRSKRERDKERYKDVRENEREERENERPGREEEMHR